MNGVLAMAIPSMATFTTFKTKLFIFSNRENKKLK